MRPIQTLSLLACLSLFAFASNAAAKEVRHAAPESNEATEAASASAERNFEGDIDGAVAAAHAAQRAQSKPATAPAAAPRSSNDGRILPSRFHSFLPGMFR